MAYDLLRLEIKEKLHEEAGTFYSFEEGPGLTRFAYITFCYMNGKQIYKNIEPVFILGGRLEALNLINHWNRPTNSMFVYKYTLEPDL